MKDYELTIVFHPDLEMNLDPALDKIKKIITTNGGEIAKEENDGKKRLSYKIAGQEFGVYYFIDVQLPAEAPAKISSVFNITDEVLRYLLVKTDERKAKLAAHRAESAESSNEAETNENNPTENESTKEKED